MLLFWYHVVLDLNFSVLSNQRVCASIVDPVCAEGLYFRRDVNSHDDDEKHIAELVKSVCKRARYVAQSVDYNYLFREHHLNES